MDKSLKVKFFIVGIISLCSIHNSLFSQVYSFKNFKHKEGLNISSITAMAEDHYGYLWLGTNGKGLIRFDGEEFDYFSEDSYFSNRYISSITFPILNDLLYGTLKSGIYEFSRLQEQNLDFFEQHSSVRLLHSFENKLLVFQDAVLQIIKNEDIIFERKIYPLNDKLILYGKYEVDNKLFVFTSRGNFVAQDEKIENLSDWLGTSDQVTSKYCGMIVSGDSLRFTNQQMTKELTVLMDKGNPKFFIEEELNSPFTKSDEKLILGTHRGGSGFFISNENKLYKWSGGSNNPEHIKNNCNKEINAPTDLLIDKNSDVWISTMNNGVFRVSKEPFTPLRIHSVFEKETISFVYKTKNNATILSTSENETFVVPENSTKDFIHYDLKINSAQNFNEIDYFATDKGLFYFDGVNLKKYRKIEAIDNKNLSLLHVKDSLLFAAIEGGDFGLIDFEANNYNSLDGFPRYIYTAENSEIRNSIYFGSDVGILEYNLTNNQVEVLDLNGTGQTSGTYPSSSTVDSYGNIWFSHNEGIIAILPD